MYNHLSTQHLHSLFESSSKKIWERIHLLGLPHKKNEAFLQFPLDVLDKAWQLPSDIPQNFETSAFLLPETENILFIDGKWQKNNTSLDALFLPLTQAYQQYGIYLQSRIDKNKKETDPFYLMHLATPSDGLFAYLPPNTKSQVPLQMLFLSTQETLQLPRIYLHLGKGASLDLCLTFASSFASFTNFYLDITLDEGASLRLIEDPNEQKGVHFSYVRAHLQKDACMQGYIFSPGNEGMRHDYRATMAGEQSHCTLEGLAQIKAQNKAHINVEMRHAAPSASSKQFFRSIVDDEGLFRFAGKIYVTPDAMQTQSYQLCENLLLSPKAHAFVQPNLEIFADDVQASHGATISRIEGKELFYLKSRGIDEEKAKKMLTQGFAQKSLSKVWIPSLQKNRILYDAVTA